MTSHVGLCPSLFPTVLCLDVPHAQHNLQHKLEKKHLALLLILVQGLVINPPLVSDESSHTPP